MATAARLLSLTMAMQLASCGSLAPGVAGPPGRDAARSPQAQSEARTVPGDTRADAARTGCLAGTFVQLSGLDAQPDEARWRQAFAEFARLGLAEIVVQWSVSGDTVFHHPARGERGAAGTIGLLLRLAAETGMGLWLGLAHDPGWWKAVEGADLPAYLARLRQRSLTAADALLPFLDEPGTRPAFRGWYISEEIDDLNWREPARAADLHAHLAALSSGLRHRAPRTRIAVSGFFDARRTPPSELAAQWDALLARAPEIDTVFLQDGIGVGNVSLEGLPAYVKATTHTAKSRGRALRVVVELFEQIRETPEDSATFRARPAGLDRVLGQLRIAAMASGAPVAFAVPNYMSTEGGGEAARLLRDYLAACPGKRLRRK